MLRGTLVRVNDKCKVAHLVGTKAIALDRIENTGYIRVLSRYKGWLSDLAYPESELDIIEPPIDI